jgi:hypothetical protein
MKGELYLLQKGAYSDKCTVGLFRALKDFTVPELDAAFRNEHATELFKLEDYEIIEWDPTEAWVPWLIKQGYIEEVDYHVIHIGDYGYEPKELQKL